MPDSPTSQRLGRFIETSAAGEKVRAFVPPPLPPEPAIDGLALLQKLTLAEPADGWPAVAKGTGRNQKPRRVPALAELDWRPASRQRLVRAAARQRAGPLPRRL